MVMLGDSETGKRLVIFDLCDTLYDANTTMGFIRHFHAMQGNARFDRLCRRWLSRKSPFFYLGAIALRLFRRDIARERLIATLAGKSRSELIEAARDYARNILPGCANLPLHDRLRSHLAAGDRVMLASSSLDIIVAEIAAKLGVGYRASKLGFEGDECTGRLIEDLTGRKSSAIYDLIDSAGAIFIYTDNRSDKDLVAIADRATIVIPRGRAEAEWGGSGCDYIRL